MAVVTSNTIREALDRIAQGALVATSASAAYVERIDSSGRFVTVTSAAGRDSATLGASIPYNGSYVEAALRSRGPVFISRLEAATRSLPPFVGSRFGGYVALVLPLIGAGELIGSVTLLGSSEATGFRAEEVERARAFSDIASFAFSRIRIVEDVAERQEENKRVMESRARLIRGFSHDVKNPLNAADGFLQLLEMHVRGPLSSEQAADVARVRRLLGSALHLIDDLLDIARTDAGKIDVRPAPTDISNLLRDVVNDFRAKADAKGVALAVQEQPGIEIVLTDPGRVRQIFANLLSNAIKYTESGRVMARVRMVSDGGASRPGSWLAIDVTDTGPGIPAERHRLLFQEFTRFNSGSNSGAGLGLAISQRIAQLLGGAITVDSEPGRGSTFTLWLARTQLPGSAIRS